MPHSRDLKEVISFLNEHATTAGAGLTTTFRMVSDPREVRFLRAFRSLFLPLRKVDARIRQVETYVRVVRKLLAELKTDLDEHETLQDLRRRALASKASMLRWLSLNAGHPDAPRVEATVASIEEAEAMYTSAMCDKSGLRNGALYFRMRVRVESLAALLTTTFAGEQVAPLWPRDRASGAEHAQ